MKLVSQKMMVDYQTAFNPTNLDPETAEKISLFKAENMQNLIDPEIELFNERILKNLEDKL